MAHMIGTDTGHGWYRCRGGCNSKMYAQSDDPDDRPICGDCQTRAMARPAGGGAQQVVIALTEKDLTAVAEQIAASPALADKIGALFKATLGKK